MRLWLLVALAISACGGGEREVEATVERFAGAVVDGDGDAVCSLMTPRAQEVLLAAVIASDQAGPKYGSCAEAASTLGRDSGDRAVEVRDATVEGPSAAAVVDYSGAELGVALERQASGAWLVSDPKQLLFGAPAGSP